MSRIPLFSRAFCALALREGLTLAAFVIPGHGAAMDRAAFRRWRGAFTALLDCARSAHAAEDCAAGWERDATGFFSEAERPASSTAVMMTLITNRAMKENTTVSLTAFPTPAGPPPTEVPM